jgi:hypothetical protein
MKSKQMQYEIKFSDKDDWNEVSENIFLRELIDSFYPITPVIIRMLRGHEVAGASVSFRIIIQPRAKGILIPGKTPFTQMALN